VVSIRVSRRSGVRAFGLPAFARSPAVLLALLAFVLYLPPAIGALQLGPDPIDYIDIARRLSAGQGYLLGVKGFHYGSAQALHNGLDERPPLYPLFAAAILRLGLDSYALQVANALLAGGCVALVYAIGSLLFGRRNGTLAGLLAAISPAMLIHTILPMAEALAILLTLLAAWLLVRDLDSPRIGSFAAAGAAIGLCYLTRPTVASMAAALLVGVVLASRRKRELGRPLIALLLGAALFALPITVYSLLTRGSVSYLGLGVLYSVFRDSELGINATLGPLPTPAQFILAHREFVAATVFSNARGYAGLLFLDPKWLLPLLPAWPLALLALVRGRYPRASWPILLLALGNFLTYALYWSTFQRRYQLLSLLLLLPFAIDGLSRLGLGRVSLPALPKLTALYLVLLVPLVVWSQTFLQEYGGMFLEAGGGEPVGTRFYRGIRWTGPAYWVDDRDLSQVLDWVGQHAERQDVLSHTQPWIFTFFTERPSTRLPLRLKSGQLKPFLASYHVAYVLLNSRDASWRRYGDDLVALEAEGVRLTPVGAYRVFDTRSLWR
jgi:hypothetical protein